jgi:hypothetical protein
MATFQEKLDHACRAFEISVDELCEATKIRLFSFHLHATGQRHLRHNEMVLLCQYFDLPGDYFTDKGIRFVDEETLPEKIRALIKRQGNKKSIICYKVRDEDSPEMSSDELYDLIKLTHGE